MLGKLFRRNKKKAVFIVQLTEGALKIVKCLTAKGKSAEFAAIEIVPLSAPADDAKIAEKLTETLRKLKFNLDPVIVSLPRINVTSRYLKVPAQNPAEIERIVSLQAPRYLPYSSEELNTGFQVIRTDKEGYSDVNLIIAHRDVTGRYVNMFRELKPSSVSVFLSSFGLGNLYHYCFDKETSPVILVDINSNQAEVAITQGEKFLFSRSFKLTAANSDWPNLLGDEVRRTVGLYLKEVSKEEPKKILVYNCGRSFGNLSEILNRQTGLAVEELPYAQKAGLSKQFSDIIAASNTSFASLIGFAAQEVSQYLNLLPVHVKETAKSASQRKNQLRLAASVCGLILIFGLSLWRNFENKSLYLKRLKSELAKISLESKPLEAIEKRFRLLQGRSRDRLSALQALYELHRNTPEKVSITNFIYDGGKELIIRGQAGELDYVFEFVARLQEAEALKKFEVKVKYATKKKTAAGEVVDFEIGCLKK